MKRLFFIVFKNTQAPHLTQIRQPREDGSDV